MKAVIMISILVLTLPLISAAKPANAGSTSASKTKNANSQLSTDIKFDGTAVGGKIQRPLEAALTEVENEKSLDDLIGVRQNFNDRRQKAKTLR